MIVRKDCEDHLGRTIGIPEITDTLPNQLEVKTKRVKDTTKDLRRDNKVLRIIKIRFV